MKVSAASTLRTLRTLRKNNCQKPLNRNSLFSNSLCLCLEL